MKTRVIFHMFMTGVSIINMSTLAYDVTTDVNFVTSSPNLTDDVTMSVTYSNSSDTPHGDRKNITVALMLERSTLADFPFSINRTIGLIRIAINRSREIVRDVADLVSICISYWCVHVRGVARAFIM